MTRNSDFKARVKARMDRTGQSYESALNSIKSEDAARTGGLSVRTREQIEAALDEAEALFKDEDPYLRQAAFDAAAHAYTELAQTTTDPTWVTAAVQAAEMYRTNAALVRFQHGIPTLFPGAEAMRIGLAECTECGRAWQLDATGACAHCPQLLWGPTPRSIEEADALPQPKPAENVVVRSRVSLDR